MVQMYWTTRGHGLSCQQDAEATAGPTVVARPGLLGCMFLLILTSWFTPLWATPLKLGWDAPTMYADGTPATDADLAGYYLYLLYNAGEPQQVEVVGNQTAYTLTDLTEGQFYTITVTAIDTKGLESLPSDPILVLVPIAQPEPVSTPADTAVSIVVLPMDTAPTDAPLAITAVTQGANGVVTITGPSVTYMPKPSFVGTDSFTYTITAEQGATTTATTTVTVLPGPPPPLTEGSPPSTTSGGTPGTIGQPAALGPRADYSVLVAYADLTDAAPANFPTPWDGSPGVIFKGCPNCPILDTGAVRIVNNTGGTLTINAVIVRLGTCTVNLWPSTISLPFGGELIVTQTANGGDDVCTTGRQLDALNVSPRGADQRGVCTNSNIIPMVDVTVNGVTTTYVDTGQILNTGGIDADTCRNGTNLSTQWTSIGSPPCPHADLTATLSAESLEVGTTATVSATFTNSCGTPLADVNVDFTSLTGPNAGTIHMDTTDRSGSASFSYTSASSGTDTLQAAVTNLAGTLTSPDVSVTWTNPASAPANTTATRSGASGSSGGGGGGCSLQPWGAWSPAAYLAALGNLALPVGVLLLLRVWSWRRQP